MFVREYNSSKWEWIHFLDWQIAERKAGSNSAFAESRNYQTVIDQFKTVENFYNYMDKSGFNV